MEKYNCAYNSEKHFCVKVLKKNYMHAKDAPSEYYEIHEPACSQKLPRVHELAYKKEICTSSECCNYENTLIIISPCHELPLCDFKKIANDARIHDLNITFGGARDCQKTLALPACITAYSCQLLSLDCYYKELLNGARVKILDQYISDCVHKQLKTLAYRYEFYLEVSSKYYGKDTCGCCEKPCSCHKKEKTCACMQKEKPCACQSKDKPCSCMSKETPCSCCQKPYKVKFSPCKCKEKDCDYCSSCPKQEKPCSCKRKSCCKNQCTPCARKHRHRSHESWDVHSYKNMLYPYS